MTPSFRGESVPARPPNPHIADRVEIRHECDCPSATVRPRGGHPEHVFTVDGVDFPWYITESGPSIARVFDDLYEITVTFYAHEVDASGVDVIDARSRSAPTAETSTTSSHP